MENLLEVQQLNKSYKNSEFQLTDITFSVKPGEVVGLIGKMVQVSLPSLIHL